MDTLTDLKRYLLSNLLTVYYSGLVLFGIFVHFLKNPFKNPWAQKLRLEPPSCLTDPKYGTHKYMICNNTKLHYLESGDSSKPLMIFVHGYPEFWYSWRHQIVEFNKDYWCIAIDLRGFGDSEKPESQSAYRRELIMDDIRDLVRKLGREKCILIAHDWGSVIAAMFRDTYPEALLAVILLGGCSIESWFSEVWENPIQMKMSWYVFFYRCPWLPEKRMQMNDLSIFDETMIIKNKDTVTEQNVECYKYWFGKPLAMTPPINYYRANFTVKVQKKPRCDLPVPFLQVNGANDPYLSNGILERMKEYYANIETVLLEGCNHFIQQEDPQKVNDLIRQFLNKHKI